MPWEKCEAHSAPTFGAELDHHKVRWIAESQRQEEAGKSAISWRCQKERTFWEAGAMAMNAKTFANVAEGILQTQRLVQRPNELSQRIYAEQSKRSLERQPGESRDETQRTTVAVGHSPGRRWRGTTGNHDRESSPIRVAWRWRRLLASAIRCRISWMTTPALPLLNFLLVVAISSVSKKEMAIHSATSAPEFRRGDGSRRQRRGLRWSRRVDNTTEQLHSRGRFPLQTINLPCCSSCSAVGFNCAPDAQMERAVHDR